MPKPLEDRVREFLECPAFAVVGASTDRTKYGNKVLRCYQQHGRAVVPVHLREPIIEGLATVRNLAEIKRRDLGVSIITPPSVSLRVVEEAAAQGLRHLWLQPGAESDEVLQRAAELGIEPIAGGPCVLVVLGYRD